MSEKNDALRALMAQEERMIGEVWQIYLDMPPRDIEIAVSEWLGARHEALEVLEAAMKEAA